MDEIRWELIADEGDGHRTWTASVTRGAPWDPGHLIEHVLLIGYDPATPGPDRYLWQTVTGDAAGENVDGYEYVATFADAADAAVAHLTAQPNLGVAPKYGPAVIVCPSADLRGGVR